MSWGEVIYIIEALSEKLDKIEAELQQIKKKLQISEEN